jgi:hypothetical protein
VIEVPILAHERGGHILQEILEDFVQATTKDLKLREEIASEGLEMRINSGAVLAVARPSRAYEQIYTAEVEVRKGTIRAGQVWPPDRAAGRRPYASMSREAGMVQLSAGVAHDDDGGVESTGRLLDWQRP